MNTTELESIAPGLFEDGHLRSELLITPELFQQHLDVVTALPKNITSVSVSFDNGQIDIVAHLTRRMVLFMDIPAVLSFTIMINEFHLSGELAICSIVLNGDISERAQHFVTQIVVSFIEDLVIFLLKGERVRYASRYTESIMDWPRVTVDLSSIEEVADIEEWGSITVINDSVSSKGIKLAISH